MDFGEKSTSDAINYMISETTENLNENRKKMTIFLDLAKGRYWNRFHV